jgi:tetratricopeptide (TPR) repeat protein
MNKTIIVTVVIIIFLIILSFIIFWKKEYKVIENEKDISIFWEWFNNNKNYLSENLWEWWEDISWKYSEWSEILSSIYEWVSYEITQSDEEWKNIIIFTADGVLEYFPTVEEIYNSAPDIENWEVKKFRKPVKWGIKEMNYEWIKYNIDDFYFKLMPLQNDKWEKFMWLNIYYKNINNSEYSDAIKTVSLLFIDHNLWEYDFATLIQWWIEFYDLPENLENIEKLYAIVSNKYLIKHYINNQMEAEIFWNKWQELFNLWKYEEAIIELDKSLEIDPNNENIYSNKWISLYSLWRYEEAMIEFNKAIKINPNNEINYINKWNWLIELEKYKEAIIEFNNAIKINPNNYDAYLNKSDSLTGLNHYKESIIELNKYIKLKPEDYLGYNNKWFSLLKLKKYKEALVEFDKALKLNPNEINILKNKKTLLEKLWRTDEIKILEEKIKNIWH